MKKILIAFWFITGAFSAAQAQTIRISFPHFAGAEYDVYVYSGVRSDTIVRAALDSSGFAQIEIPPAYRSRTGFVCWRLKQGGGLDFIVNEQDLEISCAEAEPNDANILYAPAVEHNFYLHNFRHQQQWLNKADALQHILDVYRNDSLPLKNYLQAEYVQIQSDYAAWHSLMETSDSYSARYLLARNLLEGIGSRIYASDEQDARQTDMKNFIENRLDMDMLFSSNLWHDIVGMLIEFYPDPNQWGDLFIRKLQQTRSDMIFTSLASDVISICEQKKQEEVKGKIARYLLQSARIRYPQGILYQTMEEYKVNKGDIAPKFNGKRLKNTLLFFYDSTCSDCTKELEQIRLSYEYLTNKGYEIVSVAADTEPRLFESVAQTLPWKKKFCDYKGLSGENFTNYSIIGTPTIFLIDSKGIIEGRYRYLRQIMN
jgi:peroxiredoxin